MKRRYAGIAAVAAALTLSLPCGVASAQSLGKLGGLLTGGSTTSSSMTNVAGLVKYCVENQYLGSNSGASGIQGQLLSKLGGAGATNTADTQSSGLGGMLGKLTGKKEASAEPAAKSADITQDAGYLAGAKGLLQSGNGKTTNLADLGGGSSELKTKLTDQVCKTVLKQAKSFVGGM